MTKHDSQTARDTFHARVRAWAERMKVRPARVEIRKMTRKWASCSSKRRVLFAEALLDQPSRFQDYVIVHELLHLRVPNHGRLFKSLMSAYLPEWRAAERRAGVLAEDAKVARAMDAVILTEYERA